MGGGREAELGGCTFFPRSVHRGHCPLESGCQWRIAGAFWLLPARIRAGDWAGALKVFEEGHLWVSLFRIFAGFILGGIPGIILGVVMGMNRTLRVALDPVISAVYVLPKIAILPLVMLVFGIGETQQDRDRRRRLIFPGSDQYDSRRP